MFWREAPENFANFRRRSQKIEPRAIFLQHLRGFSKKITSRPQKNDLELRGAFNFNCPVFGAPQLLKIFACGAKTVRKPLKL